MLYLNWTSKHHLLLQAPPPPRATPGSESPLVSEEPPVYSHSPGRKNMDPVIQARNGLNLSAIILLSWNKTLMSCLRWRNFFKLDIFQCSFLSPVFAAPAGYWPPLSLYGTDPQAPEAWNQKLSKYEYEIIITINDMNFKSFYTHLCSISCFMSMPCFSSSSLWAKAQSTGSTGVSAHGVLSRSRRACSGSLKRNTWLFPIMMRFPSLKKKNHITKRSVSALLYDDITCKCKKQTLGNKATISNRNSLSCSTFGSILSEPQTWFDILILRRLYSYINNSSLQGLCFPPFSSNLPDRRTVGAVTLFPLTYVSAPSHGSRMTHPKKKKRFTKHSI